MYRGGTCDLCNYPVEYLPTDRDALYYDCKRCGRVVVSGTMSVMLQNNPDYRNIKYLLSGVTRYRTEHKLPSEMILTNNYELLIDEPYVPRNINQKLELLLKFFESKTEYVGAPVRIEIEFDYPIAFCKNYQELEFLLSNLVRLNLIEQYSNGHSYILTVDGWDRLGEFNTDRIKNHRKQAFVAMWFDESLNDVYSNGFRKAIIDSGFEPMKINVKEHNNKIDDEIIAEIKKSAFIIADFTGHRGGVYFEAGFAMGLEIPVIWTCKKCDINNIHFDTRQYNHIEWENENDLYRKLINRINATIKK